MAKDKNYVPIWFWLLSFIITALPCIGFIMILVWAFTGENESRKNFFRAILILWILFGLLWLVVILGGFWPQIQHHFQLWYQRYLR